MLQMIEKMTYVNIRGISASDIALINNISSDFYLGDIDHTKPKQGVMYVV